MFSTLNITLVRSVETNYLKIATAETSTYLPIQEEKLEVYASLKEHLDEVRSNNLMLTAWANPNVPYASFQRTELLLLSYYCVLSFLKIRDARDMWMALPRIPNKLISYMRDRIYFSDHIIAYKVAILKCLRAKYALSDIDKIQSVFRACGLHEENHVFYLIFILSGDYNELVIDHTEPYALDVTTLKEEVSAFMDAPQTQRLCYHQTHTNLSFIVRSNNLQASDLANELMMNTMVAYRLARPLHSRAYSENYARRSMTNAAKRIIYAYTHYEEKKRTWGDDQGNFINREQVLTDGQDFTNIINMTDHGIFQSSVLFSEDTLIEQLDMKHEAQYAKRA